MSLSKKTQRELLKININIKTLDLIDKLNLPLISSQNAFTNYNPNNNKPTKLLTIYIPNN